MLERRSPALTIPRTALAAVALLALALLGGACGPAEAPTDADATETSADQAYTVRGEITAVPGDAMPQGQLRIHHEAIPDFVGYDGDVVGMAAMTMPFPAAERVDLSDLAPGDKIEFVLEVSWDGSPPYQISQIEKLPRGTKLDFDEEEEDIAADRSVSGTSPTPP